MEKLNVLNEKGETIGEEYRDVIHKKGLLHAEVHVWCITPEKEIIFQHRAKDKDTYPDLLDATAGGHVDLGETYEGAAVKETLEETGLHIKSEDLDYIATTQTKGFDRVTGMTNYPRRNIYLYKHLVNTDNLEVEDGKAIGFETWSIDRLFQLTEEEEERFIPTLLNEESMDIFKKIKEKI